MKKLLIQFGCLLIISTSIVATEFRYYDVVGIDLQKKISTQIFRNNIDSLYSYIIDLGYLDVSIKENVDTFLISLGTPYMIGNVYLDEVKVPVYNYKHIFTKQSVQATIDEITQKEKEKGYQFVSVSIDSLKVMNYKVNLYGSLNQGPLVRLDKIQFDGLQKTQQSFLNKYFSIEDTIITPDLLSRLEKTAHEISVVEYLPPLRQELHQGYQSATIIVPFRERENVLFEGGGGYVTENDLFVWNMLLQFQNIFGAGKELSIVSQKKDINHQLLTLKYKQPIFLSGVGSSEVLIQTRDYRDQFYEFVLNTGFDTYFMENIILGFSGQYKSVELEPENLSYRSAELSLSISNNKITQKESKKFVYDWKIKYGNRKYKADTNSFATPLSSFNESRIEIQTEIRKALISRSSLFIDLKFQSYQTDENIPPFAELYLLGGPGSIRGFKDEQFQSIRNFTATFEPQYQFDAGYFFLFYDGGYIYNRIASKFSDFDESTIYRFGYGLGISLLSKKNSLKISLGWNKTLAFDNPRVSLQLKTRL